MKEKDEICGDCCLLYIFRLDSVGLNQFNIRKVGAAVKAYGVVVYVWDWIFVRDVPRVKGSIVSTGPPTAAFFGTRWWLDDHVSSARLTVPSRSMASNSTLVTAKRPGDVCGMLQVGRVLFGCNS